MKKTIAGISVFALLAFAFPVQSAGTADVSATVTAELISVSVDDGDVSYGVLPLNTSEDTTATGVNETQTASNDGNVSIDLGIRSSDAVSGGTNWELAATTGTLDEYTHEFSINSGGAWTAFNPDNTTYSTLATVATSGTQDFDLQIGTPTSSTDTVEHTITVTVQASAS